MQTRGQRVGLAYPFLPVMNTWENTKTCRRLTVGRRVELPTPSPVLVYESLFIRKVRTMPADLNQYDGEGGRGGA